VWGELDRAIEVRFRFAEALRRRAASGSHSLAASSRSLDGIDIGSELTPSEKLVGPIIAFQFINRDPARRASIGLWLVRISSRAQPDCRGEPSAPP
jgi:hypothetical protein